MSKHVLLKWRGPYSIATTGIEEVPDTPGVYLWTISVADQYKVIYVGESSRVLWRWSRHLRSLLGGDYHIYDPDRLRNGEIVSIYEDKDSAYHLMHFTKELAVKAYENARLTQFWYAPLEDGSFKLRSRRLSVESALLSHLLNQPHSRSLITNTRLSVGQAKAYRIRCESVFEPHVRVCGLSDMVSAIEYGELND